MENTHISKLKIKNRWKDLTIGEFFLIRELLDDKKLNDTSLKIKLLQVLSGVDDNYFRDVPINEVKELFHNLDFLKVKYETELKDYYTVKGKKFKRVKQIDNLSAGQFADFMTYTKDPDHADNLNLILTVFLLPVKSLQPKEIIHNKIHSTISKTRIGKSVQKNLNWNLKEGKVETYLETPVEETANFIYDNFGIADANAIFGFFFLLSSLFSITTLFYSDKIMKNQLKSVLNQLNQMKETKEIQETKDKINSLLSGDGSLI